MCIRDRVGLFYTVLTVLEVTGREIAAVLLDVYKRQLLNSGDSKKLSYTVTLL